MSLPIALFNIQTGELLPVCCPAHVCGGPAHSPVPSLAHYPRPTNESALKAPGRVGKPAPRREPSSGLRCFALGFGLTSLLLAGAARAGNCLPTSKKSGGRRSVARLAASATGLSEVPKVQIAPVAASKTALLSKAKARTMVLRGRVLNEKGLPLVGATVLQKGTAYGTTTDASGSYSLRVPAGRLINLQYGYGGYIEQEISVASPAAAPVVLQPKKVERRRWWFF